MPFKMERITDKATVSPSGPLVLISSQTSMPGLGWWLNRSFPMRALVVNRKRNWICGLAARCSTATG